MAKTHLNNNKVGLVLGSFVAIIHAAWALAVGVGAGERFIAWVIPLHFVDIAYKIIPFDWGTAGMLVVAAFVSWYVLGWLFAWLWNTIASS